MPIWSVMWLQVPGTLSAMVFTFSFLKKNKHQKKKRSDGGLDQVIRTIFSIWERTLFRLSESRATMVRFFCYSLAHASFSRFPEANP
uniref:Uncharacterized protein n=2 Tax=Oryzias latipes TaxID=8090 RepID=A0A3P9LQ25_ORYLA